MVLIFGINLRNGELFQPAVSLRIGAQKELIAVARHLTGEFDGFGDEIQ